MILAEWGKRRWSAAVVLAAGLAAATLAAVLATVAAARPLGFLHIRSNLSRTPTLASAYPDLAVSPDGDRIVVVWTEEYYQAGAGSYNHVYLRVASETGAGWGERVSVFSDSSGLSSAYRAAVAVTGPSAYTAHVAYVVFEFDRGYLVQTEVRHKKCSLNMSPVECDASGDVVASVDASFGKIFWVDLALDASGNPHVVWAQYDADDYQGDILYRAYDGDGWGDTESVEELTGNNHTPSIAWADGYAHVAWDEQTQHQMWYRRRAASGWEPAAVPLCSPQTALWPGNPDIAAGGGRVFVVWDWCSDPQRQSRGYCAQYNLVYGRSNDSGAHWGTVREVGTDRPYAAGGLADYDSAGWYVSSSDVRDEYLQYLRPSIALNDDGGPAVVWHADRSGGGDGGDYAIYYTYAITGGGSGVNWEIAPAVLNWVQPSMLGSAVIGVGESDSEHQVLHSAYMQKVPGTGAWDVYYDSNEDKDRYETVYLPLIMNAY
jgi:hypothetical protein